MPNFYVSECVAIYKTKTAVSVSPGTLASCLRLTSVGSGQPSWPPLAHSVNTAPRVECAYQCRRHRSRGFNLWIRKIPWRRERQPTPVFLPGEFHGPGKVTKSWTRLSDFHFTLSHTQQMAGPDVVPGRLAPDSARPPSLLYCLPPQASYAYD